MDMTTRHMTGQLIVRRELDQRGEESIANSPFFHNDREMNLIPPNLLYLTIYNPSLRPSEPIQDDDEDAEEQAHILFYTSKERAVSRDRMLRQIGLAKALINFAELFTTEPCNNVHSQSKRMIMLSPEPNFWIHAGVELAKVSRAPEPKGKAKAKAKPADKGKEKDSTSLYDYEDGSVYDIALRAHIMKGYERFKLTHGSFTSILSSLGQQALELQLERFWTVWAWSWDMEESPDFGEEFGAHLHPHFSSLLPLVDGFGAHLSTNTAAVILSRPHIIPSTRYSERRYSASLATHLSTMIPPQLEPSMSSETVNTIAASVETIRGRNDDAKAKATSGSGHLSNIEPGGGAFLGMAAMNVNIDMRRWNWPGYLTFGKGTSAKPSPPIPNIPIVEAGEKKEPENRPDEPETPYVEAEVDTDDLQDAISSDSMSIASKSRDGSPNRIQEPASYSSDQGGSLTDGRHLSTEYHEVLNQVSSPPLPINIALLPEETPPPTPPPLPEFSLTTVHLASLKDPTATKRVTIHYLIRGDYMLALLNEQEKADQDQDSENTNIQYASENVVGLFENINSTVHDAGLRGLSDSVPSANKILQPQDRYLIHTGQYTLGSSAFASKSSHLYNARAILETDSDIREVFSRGQNPQHWHIAKRGIAGTNTSLGITGVDEEVFMEVFRKEASLTDVDNVLVGVVKNSGLVDGTSGSR